MCGIAGVFHYEDEKQLVNKDIVAGMTRTLIHRGPDGGGVWSAGNVGLGHRRLSIIDLSQAANQPMVDCETQNVLVFNGEIYNFHALRAELQREGFNFSTRSDTEVILLGYRKWGAEVVSRINGIFSFALWDNRLRRLFLARDRFGVKPLFFSDCNGTFLFGSEIKALLAYPDFPRQIDSEALDDFLTFSYCVAPRTGLKHIRQLLPAECSLVTAKGISTWSYWKLPYYQNPLQISFQEAVPQFQDLLNKSVRAQLVSDVPIGVFLSGGLDSAAILNSIRMVGGGPVKALHVRMLDGDSRETELAELTAKSLETPLETIELSMNPEELVRDLSLHFEEPTADSSMLAVYAVARAAKKYFTVVLTGDGADEVLAGYDTYRATFLAERYRRIPCTLRRILMPWLLRLIPVTDHKYSLYKKVSRFVYGAELGFGRDLAAWRVIFSRELKHRVLSPRYLDSINGRDALSDYAAHVHQAPPSHGRLAGLLHADVSFYLPNDMLVKVDRATMAASVEARVPFLDENLVTFAANLPPEYKLHNNKRRKHILRETLRGRIPDAVLSAPKSGFNVPIEKWFRSALKDMLIDVVQTERVQLSQFFELSQVDCLINEHLQRKADHAHVLFTVLLMGLWCNNIACQWKSHGHVLSTCERKVAHVG